MGLNHTNGQTRGGRERFAQFGKFSSPIRSGEPGGWGIAHDTAPAIPLPQLSVVQSGDFNCDDASAEDGESREEDKEHHCRDIRCSIGTSPPTEEKNHHCKIEQYVIDIVRKMRTEKGISQRELAYLLDVSVGFIGDIENPNYRAKYNLNHINELAKLLDCSPKDFFPDMPL